MHYIVNLIAHDHLDNVFGRRVRVQLVEPHIQVCKALPVGDVVHCAHPTVLVLQMACRSALDTKDDSMCAAVIGGR